MDCDVLSEVNHVLRSPRGLHKVVGDVNNDQRILCLVYVDYDVLSDVIIDRTIFYVVHVDYYTSCPK